MLGVVLALSLLWRLPSLFDPPWVNDEGTYYAVAQGMAHGLRLYAQVWENKPPAIYLIFGAIYHFFGASLFAVRVVASAAILGTVALTARLGERFRDPSTGILVALIAGLLFGVPVLEGTTANAETFAAPLAAGAVYLGLVRDRWFIAGALVGLAILLKSVGVFDGAALGVWVLVHKRHAIAPYVLAIVAMLAACVLVTWREGILRPMLHDAFLYDVGYVNHANGGGLPWVLVLKIAVLVTGTAWLVRRSFPWLWFMYAVVGALFGGRIFGHYFLQAVVPCALCLTPAINPFRVWRAVGVALASTVGLVAASTGAGWVLEHVSGPSIFASRLQYYANAAGLATGRLSYSDYSARLDDHVNRNLAIVDVLRTLPSGRLLIWGNTPWIYPLSGRLPATAFTSSLRSPVVAGETAALRRAVLRGRARVLVIIDPPEPSLGSASPLSGYTQVARRGNAWIYTS